MALGALLNGLGALLNGLGCPAQWPWCPAQWPWCPAQWPWVPCSIALGALLNGLGALSVKRVFLLMHFLLHVHFFNFKIMACKILIIIIIFRCLGPKQAFAFIKSIL
jgi:hypothetical protein